MSAKPVKASHSGEGGSGRKKTAGRGAPAARRGKRTVAAKTHAAARSMKRPAAQTGKKRAAARRRRRARKAMYGLLSAACFALIAAIGAFCGIQTSRYFRFLEIRSLLDTDAFYPGMVVDGTDLGGMRLSEALELMREREVDLSSQGLIFTLDGGEYTITPGQAGYGSNYEAVVRGAWERGRRGTLEERYAAASAGCRYSVSRGYDSATLRATTDAIAAGLTVAPVDAEVTGFIAKRGEFTFSDEQPGSVVDADALFAQAQAALESGSSVAVERTVLEPAVTREELENAYGEISVAVTNASSSNSNRLSNIKLACSSLLGYCLEPGAEFSFNEVVGKRTAAAGYRVAGVYVSGELGEEIGGGICQVATTLFNAAVKADLEITERHAHSRTVSYVEKGKDATVSWGLQDLKFVNKGDTPVYIVAYVTDNARVKIHIFGKLRTDGLTIRLVPQLRETIQPGGNSYRYADDLPSGETRVKSEARKGYKVNTYKVWYDADGNAVAKEFLCYSHYPAAGAVIEVGR